MATSDNMTRETRRAYRSPVREQLAADTRHRIAAAAKDLFAERGFSGTTVADIAARAEVAAPTVYATFGSKGAIVGALLAQMEHDANNVEWVERIAQETDPRAKLEAFATWTTTLFSTSKMLIQAANVASADPAMNALREEGNRHRREALGRLIGSLVQANALSSGLSEDHAVDRAWMLTGVELYVSAIDGCGWTDEQYQQWLAALLQQQLL
ncbi:TetR/AcrR family transcriptional regulator [Tessaracoccus antarcticus]|uniref:TetR/AcrR family transcriptional regulator n=1 Tax=Tessaracoccus antarcticus TaxID=2479848 RepID=A0A3M0G936_9ACTN|nr:TetR/AcrR family transcriptional regulator [Tessaracoccus antarcticus]RMB61464.1 TetR/AcrR family transcriptional regulator [Tessaracoccus antarcticus]